MKSMSSNEEATREDYINAVKSASKKLLNLESSDSITKTISDFENKFPNLVGISDIFKADPEIFFLGEIRTSLIYGFLVASLPCLSKQFRRLTEIEDENLVILVSRFDRDILDNIFKEGYSPTNPDNSMILFKDILNKKGGSLSNMYFGIERLITYNSRENLLVLKENKKELYKYSRPRAPMPTRSFLFLSPGPSSNSRARPDSSPNSAIDFSPSVRLMNRFIDSR